MTERKATKLVHEGKYVAEVDVMLLINEDEWAPYLTVEDANKLDAVRMALRDGNVGKASQFGRVFRLVPVAV